MSEKQQALVLGLGESGQAAARLFRREGAEVVAVDAAHTPALEEAAVRLAGEGIVTILGARDLPDADADLAVVSPGIPPDSPWRLSLARRGVPVLSELEAGWRRRSGRVLAVTGSNGKSTLVKWLADALNRADLRAAPVGNYGDAACRVALERPELDWWVLEVSSFQLETVRDFRPDVGVVLNVLPNHLDRHGDMDAYTALKARLFARTLEDDVCIAPLDRWDVLRAASAGRGRWVSFGGEEGADYRYRAGGVFRRNGERALDLAGTPFDDAVLGLAAAAAAAAMEACGADPEHAARAARAFEPLPHRMQFAGEAGGVLFINDSKATNLAALSAALRRTDRPVRLIAGGRAKEKDFSSVRPLLAGRVRAAYLLGEAEEALASAWSDVAPCERCGTLDKAFRRAAAAAAPGEAVLLSPACTSYDQFRNYEERGELFLRRVEEWRGGRGSSTDCIAGKKGHNDN